MFNSSDMPGDFPPMLISGSISPCYTTTPFYSYIFYDRQTKFPVDIVTYNLNLDEVQNETMTSRDDVSGTFNQPWKRMFQNLTSFLGISSLTNRETLLLADRLASNASDDNTSVTFEKYFQTWYKGVPQVCDDYCRKQEACLITCGFSGSTWESCVNDGDSCSLSPAVSPTSNPPTSVGSSPWQNIGLHGSIILLTLLLSFTIITL